MEFVDQFSETGELVMDLFSRTFATTKACLELLRHRSFVGCDIGADCFAVCTQALVQTHARQILNEKSHIYCTNDVMADDVVDDCKERFDRWRGCKQGIGPDCGRCLSGSARCRCFNCTSRTPY